MKMQSRLMLSVLAASVLASGCATKKFVRTEVGAANDPTNARVDDVETRLEATQSEIDKTNRRNVEQDAEISEASKTAQDALDRAIAAGKLAEGTLVSETVFNNDQVRFKINTSDLTDDSKVALDTFAEPLISENRSIYLEIQGHTDSSGPEGYNYQLGEQRAEAVRRYLNQQHGFPLHRMSVISYGESAPAYDNDTLEGRRSNRRVVLVVLK